MIEVKNLCRKYGARTAVKSLSFKIYNGKIYGLLGANGAGKSTTMNMITGCLSPTSGSVKINGFDIVKEPLSAKACIGYLPEIPPLWEELTPYEYLEFIADARGVSYDSAVSQIKEAMVLTDIADVSDRLIKHLSKGYRQRVGIAGTLLGDPDIIILDEPPVGLDPKQITEVRALIRKLGESKTVILSSHILAEIQEVCDHVLIIANGELVANAPIEELQRHTETGVRLRLSVRGDEAGILSVLNTMDAISFCTVAASHEEGVVNLVLDTTGKEDLRDAIFFAMADHRYAVISMEREEQTLESIFLQLTDGEKNQPSNQKNETDGEYELIDEEEDA